jgi:hypothetical protein
MIFVLFFGGWIYIVSFLDVHVLIIFILTLFILAL